MPLSTFLNDSTVTRLRGLQWLALSDLGQVGSGAVTDDTGGGGTMVWTYGSDVPCRIDPLTDNETVAAGRISDRSTHIVTVPPGTAVSTSSRFRITGRGTYEVTGVQDRTGELARFFEVVQVVGADTATVPFSPTDLGASLAAWWKADTLALSNGAAVTSWADSSGNARTLTQATGANQPVFNTAQINGLPAVTLDGTNDYLATAAFASATTGYSVYVVQNLNRAGAGYKTVACHAAAATWIAPFARLDFRVQAVVASEAWYGGVEDQTAAANTLIEPAIPTTGWQIMEFVYDQTNLRLLRGGTSLATKARSGALTSSTQPLFVGADTTLGNNYQGQIAELLVYHAGHGTTDRTSVENYLKVKYAL